MQLVENAASWESFHTAVQDITSALESVSMVVNQGTIEGQDRSSPVYSKVTNAGNKQGVNPYYKNKMFAHVLSLH